MQHLHEITASTIHELGFHSTTTDEIIQRAGIAKGTLYHYFTDRNALIAQTQLHYSRECAKAAELAFEAGSERCWESRLRSWAEAGLAFYIQHRALFGTSYVQDSKKIESELSVLAPLILSLQGRIECGEETTGWHIENSEITAMFALRGAIGTIDELLMSHRSIAPVHLSAIMDNFLRCVVTGAFQPTVV